MNGTDTVEHSSPIPMIGLGGSAGDIGALQELFKTMPVDSGMVFVVVMHQPPKHESMLATLLQQSTTMPVIQVTERIAMKANEIYVLPPGKVLTSADGYLTLLPPERDEKLITVNQELEAKVDELATANSDLHNLMAATAISMVFLDRALCITRFTPSALSLFKFIDTALGRPLTDVQHLLDYPDMARDAQAVLDTLKPLEREVSAPDGACYLARVRPHRTPDDFIGGVVLTFVDITENKRTQQALETSRQQLLTALQETEQARAETEAAGEAKDHFLAVLSHELRTPLTPVLMATHALDKHPDFPDPLRHLLAMIQRNVQTETRFIDDLLDVTRIANGKLQVVRQPMDLHEAVEGALEISADDARRREQKVTLTLEATDTAINGDRERLQQALWNLIKNASKFSHPGSEIRVSSHSDNSQIYITIEDSGIGISPQDLPRIFDAYVQATLGVASQYGGLGLGLSIANATVQAHGGSISARSDGEGRGATFVVALPLNV